MLSATELILLALVVFLVFGIYKLPVVSRALARLRLNFDKGIADEYIDLIEDEYAGDDSSERPEQEDSPSRPTHTESSRGN